MEMGGHWIWDVEKRTRGTLVLFESKIKAEEE